MGHGVDVGGETSVGYSVEVYFTVPDCHLGLYARECGVMYVLVRSRKYFSDTFAFV